MKSSVNIVSFMILSSWQRWGKECRNGLQKAIYLVINRFQIGRMKNIVHTIDPAAFLTISEVADVFRSINAANVPETPEATEEILS